MNEFKAMHANTERLQLLFSWPLPLHEWSLNIEAAASDGPLVKRDVLFLATCSPLALL